MSQPPRTKRKLGAEAQAEVGQLRTCTACGDEKEVGEQTYTPFNKGLRGWKTICKVCEGLNASGKPRDHHVKPADGESADLIIDMYLEGLSPTRNQARLDAIIVALSDRIRKLAETDREASFRLFVDVVKPLVADWVEPGPIHDDIIEGLLSQHRRRLIIATRYSAKSTLTAIYVAWRIFLDPLLKVMVVSHGEKLAARMLRIVRRTFLENCPMLAHLVPNDDCLDNAEQFQVPQTLAITVGGATFTSLGITSNLPGFRSDLTIGDDVEGRQVDTPEKVESLEEILNELHMINPSGEKVMLGTYQSEFSVYARLADRANDENEPVWELHRACMFEEDTLDGKLVIHSRWPARFSEKQAMDWRRAVTQRAWRLHMMLVADASLLNEKPLKISQFILVDHSPEDGRFPLQVEASGPLREDVPKWSAPKGDDWYGPRLLGKDTSNYAMTVVGVDPASGLAGRDAMGVAVVSITPSGYGVIRHLEGVRGPDKLGNIRRVASIITHYNATNVQVEEMADGFFGETLEGQLIQMGFPMQVTKVTTGGQQKGRRIIETLSPPMAAGRIVMLEKVARSDHGGDFVNQMVRCTWDGRTGRAKDHDDIVDALAHAVAAVKGSLVSDIHDNMGEHYVERMDHWRGLPLRLGGLGIHGDVTPHGRRLSFEAGLEGDMPMAERLLEEDQVLVKLEQRMLGFQETVQTDLRAGRRPDPRMLKQIVTLKKQTDELRSMQVL